MMSLDDFKKTLPKDHSLTEEEIIKARDLMDLLADIVFEKWLKE